MIDDGAWKLPLWVGAALMGGLLLERSLVRRASVPYYAAGFPLPRPLVPIRGPLVDAREGRAGPFRWRRADDDVWFWADPDDRRAPSLLHGHVKLVQTRGATALVARWSPPWTPLLGCGWLMTLGAVRGEAGLTATIGAALIASLLILYLRGATQAAAYLRLALQPHPDGGDSPDDAPWKPGVG